MNKTTDDDSIIQLFIRLINSFMALEKKPRDFGVGYPLFPSEIHILEAIGECPGIKLTDIAKALGITKGAVPKIIRKLETKDLVTRYKSNDNKKEVLFRLTIAGHTACAGHKKFHDTFDKTIRQKMKLLNEEQKSFLHYVFTELDQYALELLMH